MKQTLFYQHVTVLDYAYTDDHLGVVGDSAIVDVELIGEQNSEFMLLDFGKVKSQIKGEIDFLCDHRLVVPSSCVEQLSDQQVRLVYSFGPKESQLEYLAPKQAYFLLDSHRVSDESLTTELEKLILKKLPTNITGLKISLRREQKLEEVYFQYTHGLKLHGGNCQRLLHGHRNTLRVKV